MDNSDRRLFSMNLRLELDNLCVADSKYMGKPKVSCCCADQKYFKTVSQSFGWYSCLMKLFYMEKN